MKPVNIHDAKTRFSRLVARAARGEEIIIARAGHPVAKLVAYRAGDEQRIAPPGSMRGRIWAADDFDAPLDELFEAVTTAGDE
jgi:prevent-host-death family protein